VRSIRKEALAGFGDILPPALAGIPIGLLIGAAAAAKGLSPLAVFVMSASMFAGSAQLAAIEQWSEPVPVIALAFGTLLINARHILMGASLTPKTAAFSAAQRFLGFFAMADENWALSERRAATVGLTPAYYFAMTVLFYVNYVVWCTIGASLGALMGDPRRFGADFALTALFIGLVAGLWRGRATAVTVVASGLCAAAVKVTAGAPWHVPAGAFAGIAAAYLAAAPEEQEA
jgi:4-azaleucine resistance transporter AzlC